MKIKITYGDWQTKKLVIKDKTMFTLSDGKQIPTWLNRQRQIAKI